ncbi:hypothetical protein CAPTEDRAFT_54067, partial [Capitella teleta]
VPVTFTVIFICGVLGNGLVMFVIMCMKRRALRKVTNIYLINLAVADLLVLLFCVPFTGLTYTLESWPFGKFVCKMVDYLMMTSMASSIWTMAAMSIDRYCAVVGPNCIKPYRTVRSTVGVLASIWVVNAILFSPLLIMAQIGFDEYEIEVLSHCFQKYPNRQSKRAYLVGVFLGYYVLPLIVTTASYFLLTRNMWGNIGPKLSRVHTLRAIRRHRHVCLMVLIMVCVFGICWLPVYAVNLYNEFSSEDDQFHEGVYVVLVVGHCLSYLNSALNPIIYSFMSHIFRQCCKE